MNAGLNFNTPENNLWVAELAMVKQIKNFLGLVVPLILSAIACQSTAEVIRTPNTEIEQVTPIPSEAAVQANLFLEDAFDDPNSGFLRLRDEEGITDYDQGGYRIKVDKTNYFFWAESGQSFSDVQIDVDTTTLGGPESSEFGVICRYKDEDNFYFFSITSDGYYGVSKHIGEEYEFIGMDEFKSSPAINKGQAQNHLTAVCEGDKLRFSVNGTLLAEVEDNTITLGDVGLIAGTEDTAGTDILFDNLIVLKP